MKQVSETRPWLMPEVIDWLESILKPDWTVLETGCGGSTIFFADRVRTVITYEHKSEWAAKLNRQLRSDMILRIRGNVILRYDPTYPTAGLSHLPPLDLAFIDGRGRVRSVIDALPHIKPGGWLILDDSDRERYGEALRVAGEACSAKIVFRSEPDQTTAWRMR